MSQSTCIWCDPWPRNGVVSLNPTGGMAGLCTLVKPLVKCVLNQLYDCSNYKKLNILLLLIWSCNK